MLYPDYSVAISYKSKHQERLAKEEQLNKLRADLKLETRYDQRVGTTFRYLQRKLIITHTLLVEHT